MFLKRRMANFEKARPPVSAHAPLMTHDNEAILEYKRFLPPGVDVVVIMAFHIAL